MKNLQRRLRLLELGSRGAGCLECECRRLNHASVRATDREEPCAHRSGATLLDALRGLNALEAEHAIS